MKPYDGGGWKAVSRIPDEATLRKRYEESGTMVMHLQAGVDPFDRFVRCIGFGPQTTIVRYDPSAPLHDRYTMKREPEFLSPLDQQVLRDTTLTINAFFGWDFNSCESLRKDGVWYPIDFANPCPDSQVTSLHYHFPWLVKAYLKWAIFTAATKRPMRKAFDWQPFYDIAKKPTCPTPRSSRSTRARRAALRDRALRGVDRAAPAAPRRGGLGVLRHAGGQGRGAQRKVAALFPAHEVEQFTELFWNRGAWQPVARRSRRQPKKTTAARWYSQRLPPRHDDGAVGHVRAAGAALPHRRRRRRRGRALLDDEGAGAAHRRRQAHQGLLVRQRGGAGALVSRRALAAHRQCGC